MSDEPTVEPSRSGLVPAHTVSGPRLADFGLGSPDGGHTTRAPRPELRSLELFAGGGGMALGMRAAGFKHTALVEWWAPAAKVLRHNAELRPELWKPDEIIQGDVRKALGRFSDSDAIHMIAGGPPCQPFSFAGAHVGDMDERNMFPAALDAVRRVRPKLVVFENVPGLTRPGFAPYLDYVKAQLRHPDISPGNAEELWSDHYNRILASSEEPTYNVSQDVLDAADLGVPQSRKRVFIVGIRRDVPGADSWSWDDVARKHSRDVLLHQQYVTGEYWGRHDLTQPAIPVRQRGHVRRVERIGVPETSRPWITLRDALAAVPEPADDETPGWPNHRAIPGARSYAKHTGSPLDMPSKTIKAGVHGVSGGEAMLRELDGTIRYLTVRESALVQGFPTDYEFPGPRSRVMGVIGNAVAVDVAFAVGAALREHTGL
jgi:DNA (cytosine-5)-methyltransferase 1